MEMITYNYTHDQLIKMLNTQAYDDCDRCGGIREVSYEAIRILIDGRRIEFESIPMLKCKSCGELAFTRYSQEMIFHIEEELKKRPDKIVVCKPSNYKGRFHFCEDIDFEYDHRDYKSVPGLLTPMSDNGSLQPVYFKKDALLYFFYSPEYYVNIFSESYGELERLVPVKEDTDEKWSVPFGFNTKGNLVFWLCDLDSMDYQTRAILKPFNVPSDHLLIDSDFYRAQIKVIWSEPIQEQKIILNKKAFMKNVEKIYGIKINHLDEECDDYAKKAVKPIVYTEKTLSESLNALHKVLIEGMETGNLKAIYEKLYKPDERDKDYKNFGNIKFLDYIIRRTDQNPNTDFRTVIGPIYLLNDFRIVFDHLLSKDKLEEKKNNIIKTLGLTSFSDYKDAYTKELDGLDKLYQYLILITK